MRDLHFIDKIVFGGIIAMIGVIIFGGWLMAQLINDWKAPPALIGEGVFQEKKWGQVKLSDKIYEIPTIPQVQRCGHQMGRQQPFNRN